MKRIHWNELGANARTEALARPAQGRATTLSASVADIISDVRREGDQALKRYTLKFDGCELESMEASVDEFAAAETVQPENLKRSLASAITRIESFHRASAPQPVCIETAQGVVCESMPRAIARVGLYVPAGSAPLFSTLLMLGVPARLAGCRQRVICTPPRSDGLADPTVLYVAQQLGISQVYKVGGAQAIAAMAFGTDSVPRCDKLFGPGNAWVTEAKRQVSMELGGPAIDMPAGPSEVLVIADRSADARLVAADLLSQAEHGPDSQVLLITDAPSLADAVMAQLEKQLETLPRADVARQALAASRVILVTSMDQALQVSNAYAPEHLILNVRQPRVLLAGVESAGSIFLGPWSPEAVGDYCSGPNHVLPTDGHARVWSGLSVASFQKQISVQELSAAGLSSIGPDAVVMSEAEGLVGHARAVRFRLKNMVTE